MTGQLFEVRRPGPAPQTTTPSVWRKTRQFDRFTGGFGFPSIRRTFDVEPSMRFESSLPCPTDRRERRR